MRPRRSQHEQRPRHGERAGNGIQVGREMAGAEPGEVHAPKSEPRPYGPPPPSPEASPLEIKESKKENHY